MAKITVGVPVYYLDKRSYVQDCLDSIVKQTFKDFQVIIVFEGHSSEYEQLVSEVLSEVDYRTIINDNPKGLALALNQMLENCETEFLKRMDSDDVMSPHAIEVLNDYCNNEVTVIGSWAKLIDSKGDPFGYYKKSVFRGNFPFSTLITPPFIHPSVVLNVNHLRKWNIRYSTNDSELISVMVEDWHLWNQIRVNNGYGIVIPEYLLEYRVKNHERQFDRFKNSIIIKKRYLKAFSLNIVEFYIASTLYFLLSKSLFLIKFLYKLKYKPE